VLIIFGLVTSIPLIVAGSALLMSLLDRFPILVWAGAALLGWVAGDIMAKDSALERVLSPDQLHTLHFWAAAAGAVFVVGLGWWMKQRQHKSVEDTLVADPPGPEKFPHKH
jgi:predicted tellurium resistance membrane protein TerC